MQIARFLCIRTINSNETNAQKNRASIIHRRFWKYTSIISTVKYQMVHWTLEASKLKNSSVRTTKWFPKPRQSPILRQQENTSNFSTQLVNFRFSRTSSVLYLIVVQIFIERRTAARKWRKTIYKRRRSRGRSRSRTRANTTECSAKKYEVKIKNIV